MTLDELLHRYIGDMGCYQMCMFILLALCSFCGVEVLFTTFLAVEVPHICAVPALANLSYGQQENIVSPLVNHNGATGYSKCTMFDLDYSTFTIQDYQNWNRTAILQTHKPKVVHCKEYVFHPKDFSGSVVEQVIHDKPTRLRCLPQPVSCYIMNKHLLYFLVVASLWKTVVSGSHIYHHNIRMFLRCLSGWRYC